LVIKQVSLEYKCLNINLVKYFLKIQSLLQTFDSIHFEYMPQESNNEADDFGTNTLSI